MLGTCPHHIGFAGIAGDFCELRPAADEYEGNGPNGSLVGDMAGVASPLPGCFPPKKFDSRRTAPLAASYPIQFSPFIHLVIFELCTGNHGYCTQKYGVRAALTSTRPR